jgi:subtilase family serine protease
MSLLGRSARGFPARLTRGVQSVRARRLIASLGAGATVAGLALVGIGAQAGAAPLPQYTRLAGSVAPFAASSRATGAVSGATRLSVQVWLKPNLAAAEKYVAAATAPGSAQFGHYLSPDAYTAAFGASKAAAASVESWLRGQGFSGVSADAQRDYVRATAPVSVIDSAFKVRMENYRSSAAASAGSYTLRSNNEPVAVPAALSGAVSGVTGLDNAKPTLPLEYQSTKPEGSSKGLQTASSTNAPCSYYYGERFQYKLRKEFGTNTFPTEVCGYNARQLRAAYDATSAATGKGQKIALIELGLAPDMFATLRDYAKVNKLPAPSRSRYHELSLGQGTACGDEFFVEEQLDVEASYAMAPSAHQLVVGGDSCNDGDFGFEGLFNADLAVINGNGHHPLATVVSNSWEANDLGEEQPPANTAIETNYMVRAAAEGVGMYFSAGDGSRVFAPSDNPYAISVGGTTLGIGKGGKRLFETGWSTGQAFETTGKHGWMLIGEQGASGGGPSMLWKQPGYQRGVVPAKLAKSAGNRSGPVRSVPDISADADPFTGFLVGLLEPNEQNKLVYTQFDIGGTSESSPLVAGLVADAQQGMRRSFGFINPVLYKLEGTNALHYPQPLTKHSPVLWRAVACDPNICGIQSLLIFDDQNPRMYGYYGQVDLSRYNNMTGVGTPNGYHFIHDLRVLER